MEQMLGQLKRAVAQRHSSQPGTQPGTQQLSTVEGGGGPDLCPELPTPEAVLFVCLHEIGRQVSVTCEDRGRLLFSIRS